MDALESPVSPDLVRAQLERILASSGFASSPRLRRFLRFIVQRTLDGEAEVLKEFVVALEVFDRNDDYDPRIDSVVRVEARRLRAKLTAYYEAAGQEDTVWIGLRPGSYVPSFRRWRRPVVPAVEPPPAHYTSVAVLPFANLSPEPGQDYFCDGIAEEIINALASIDHVAVVSRTSSFQFKGRTLDVREVGGRLGAELIVEGSVRKAGDQLRISAQATDAARGYHLWSETYRRNLQDVFAIQEEISSAVATVVRAKLPSWALRTTAARQPSIAAYTGYFRALHLVHQETLPSLQAALEQFRELAALYPDYADPHAGIATVYAALSIFGVVSGREVFPDLHRHAQEALRLDPESSAAWTVLAGVSAHWEFDWPEAERRFRRAIAIQPSNSAAHAWFGGVLAMLGRFDEAESEYETAIRLNPLVASGHARMGFLCYLRGRDSQAESHLLEALQLEREYPEARFALAMMRLHQGDCAAAVEILSRDLDQTPIALHVGLLAGAYHRLGEPAKSQEMLVRLDRMAAQHYVSPMARVAACIGMGDLDGAMEALSASIRDRAIFANVLNVDPFLDPLRADPRFQQLVASINLVPAASAQAASPG